jgi:predicted metalloprotease with PDZ domain
MRGGHETIEEYEADINETFRSYFTSPARNLTADSITTIGFSDETARRIPYWRGSFYFADLDGRMRAASHGERGLDDLMLDMFERRARGDAFDHEVWIETVVREIGPEARDQFESVILRGETIIPRSDAFGPCFRRRTTSVSGGDAVEGFEWVRVSEVPDGACRGW